MLEIKKKKQHIKISKKNVNMRVLNKNNNHKLQITKIGHLTSNKTHSNELSKPTAITTLNDGWLSSNV